MKHTYTPAQIIANFLKWILLLSLLAVALLPLLWLLISSLRTNLELQTNPFGWPKDMQWVNYAKALAMASLPRLLLNSAVVAASSVILNSAVTAMASFILARERFRGRDVLYTLFTAGVLVPVISFMVPYFSLITKSGLYNTLLALVLVYTGSEYSCFNLSGNRLHEVDPQGVGRGQRHRRLRLFQAVLGHYSPALPFRPRHCGYLLLHLQLE